MSKLSRLSICLRCGLVWLLRRWRSGRRDSQTLQPVTGLRGLDRARIAGDEAVQLAHSGLALAEFQQCVTFLQLRSGCFASTGVLFEDFVVIFHSRIEVALTILDVGEIELRIAREVGGPVILQVVAEFLRRQIVFTGVVVAQRVVKQRVRGRR